VREALRFELNPRPCPACPIAPGDGTGVGGNHPTGVRD